MYTKLELTRFDLVTCRRAIRKNISKRSQKLFKGILGNTWGRRCIDTVRVHLINAGNKCPILFVHKDAIMSNYISK